MRIEQHFVGWVCVDCLHQVANGTVPDELDQAEVEQYLHNVQQGADGAELSAGAPYGEDGCEHDFHDDEHHDQHTEDCETQTFSWSPCELCGSTLGGSRHAITWLYTS